MLDFLITNAMIYDGSGLKPFMGSVAVKDGRIAEVFPGETAQLPARQIVDAGGLALCPGFVDTHTHSDMVLLHDGRQHASVSQGVTTEILGQDGLSYAPLKKQNLLAYTRYLRGLNGQFDDVPLDFETVSDYLSRYEGKIGVNAAWLVPHCALRLETAGFENRLMTDDEIKTAARIAKESIEQGACGFSTGLSYYPGSFCDTRELIEICKAVREADGVYVTHLRSVFRDKPFSAVEEALQIARESGVKLHYSHFRTGGATIGHADELLAPIDKAVQDGLDVTLELYPYPYGASYAPMFVPMWANEGGMDAILDRLAQTELRARIANDIDKAFPLFDGVITYAGNTPQYMGRTFSSLAKERGQTKGETIADLLLSEELALSFHDVDPRLSGETQDLFEKDVLSMLSRPYYMVGSDGIHVGDWPHPRGSGSFARLWRIARKHGFPFETLVERLSALPARRFGLKDRGRILAGYFADLVLLDPQTITDLATDEDPRRLCSGVKACWVNGVPAMDDGVPTDALGGQVLRFRKERKND